MPADGQRPERRPTHHPFAVAEAQQVGQIGRAGAKLLDRQRRVGAGEFFAAQISGELVPVELFLVADVTIFGGDI